jgi:hypothetical protein
MPYTYVTATLYSSPDYENPTPCFSLAIDLPTFFSMITDHSARSRIVIYPASHLPVFQYAHAHINIPVEVTHCLRIPVRIILPPIGSIATEDIHFLALATDDYSTHANYAIYSETALTHDIAPPLSIMRPTPAEYSVQSIDTFALTDLYLHRFAHFPTPVPSIDYNRTLRTYIDRSHDDDLVTQFIRYIYSMPSTLSTSTSPTYVRLPYAEQENTPSDFILARIVTFSQLHPFNPETLENRETSDPSHLRDMIDFRISQRHPNFITIHDDPDDPTIDLTFDEIDQFETAPIATEPDSPQFTTMNLTNTEFTDTEDTSDDEEEVTNNRPDTPAPLQVQITPQRPPRIPFTPRVRIEQPFNFIFDSLSSASLAHMLSLCPIPPPDQERDFTFGDIHSLMLEFLAHHTLPPDSTIEVSLLPLVYIQAARFRDLLSDYPTLRDLSSLIIPSDENDADHPPPEFYLSRVFALHLPHEIRTMLEGRDHICPYSLLCPLNSHNDFTRRLTVSVYFAAIGQTTNTYLRDNHAPSLMNPPRPPSPEIIIVQSTRPPVQVHLFNDRDEYLFHSVTRIGSQRFQISLTPPQPSQLDSQATLLTVINQNFTFRRDIPLFMISLILMIASYLSTF